MNVKVWVMNGILRKQRGHWIEILSQETPCCLAGPCVCVYILTSSWLMLQLVLKTSIGISLFEFKWNYLSVFEATDYMSIILITCYDLIVNYCEVCLISDYISSATSSVSYKWRHHKWKAPNFQRRPHNGKGNIPPFLNL